MNKLIKVGTNLIVQFSDGRTFNKENVTKEEFIEISDHIDDDDYLESIFNPHKAEYDAQMFSYKCFIDDVNEIPFLFFRENAVYWLDVSPHSMPEDFVKTIIKAYKEDNQKALKAYKNFWILTSLNPSEEVRKNLWWFLKIHGLVVSSTGFFIGYRNADKTTKVDDEGNPIYTDRHTHTTKISIGHTVSMDRSKCDLDSNHQCSYGLHLGGAKWLEENYYGDTGFVCLVNPYNVTALPKDSTYGKMRCCEYMPIDYAQFDENKHIIPYNVEQGFECKYAAQAIYEGVISIEQNAYNINAPVDTDIDNANTITENLLKLAKECITNKDYHIVDNLNED